MEQKVVKWYPLSFRGQNVKVLADRIEAWNREHSLFYYQLQSTDENWVRPSILTTSVRRNFWGMMACPMPLVELDGVHHVTTGASGAKVGQISHITLTNFEVEAIMTAMSGRPCTIQRNTRVLEFAPRHDSKRF